MGLIVLTEEQVRAIVKEAIEAERERVAKAAGMAASTVETALADRIKAAKNAGVEKYLPVVTPSVLTQAMADFARRVRSGV